MRVRQSNTRKSRTEAKPQRKISKSRVDDGKAVTPQCVERDNILSPEEAPDASSKLFREYAAEFVELARNATSADQRFLYLKMANIWQETAIRWERDLVKDQEKLRRDSNAGRCA
jgi:hypothetical protein